MTKLDKQNLSHFINRTGMYINPVDAKNVVSFLHGYELATENKCHFTQSLKQLLTDKYKMLYSSDGWPGQIERLANKCSSSWLTTFKKIAVEIIGSETLAFPDQEVTKV